MRVAIVGGGAAGMACAHDLALLGHEPVLFDSAREPGGVMTRVIPPSRFATAATRAECSAILARSVEFHPGEMVDGARPLRQLLDNGFDAIFLAIGAWRPHGPVDALRDQHANVTDALDLLAHAAVLHGRVTVVGDGVLAVDAARTVARRASETGSPASVTLALATPLEEGAVPPAMSPPLCAKGLPYTPAGKRAES